MSIYSALVAVSASLLDSETLMTADDNGNNVQHGVRDGLPAADPGESVSANFAHDHSELEDGDVYVSSEDNDDDDEVNAGV